MWKRQDPPLGFKPGGRVVVGNFGSTKVSEPVLKAYAEANAIDRLERNVQAMQEHAWLMETSLEYL